jgi:hypothetical protein
VDMSNVRCRSRVRGIYLKRPAQIAPTTDRRGAMTVLQSSTPIGPSPRRLHCQDCKQKVTHFQLVSPIASRYDDRDAVCTEHIGRQLVDAMIRMQRPCRPGNTAEFADVPAETVIIPLDLARMTATPPWSRGVEIALNATGGERSSGSTLHPTPCTLHPAPCTLHPKP